MTYQSMPYELVNIKADNIYLINNQVNKPPRFDAKCEVVFGISLGPYQIKCSFEFFLLTDNMPLIYIKVHCYFDIDAATWKRAFSEQGKVTISHSIASDMARITQDETRKILEFETQSTEFNQYLVPYMNPREPFQDDRVVISYIIC